MVAEVQSKKILVRIKYNIKVKQKQRSEIQRLVGANLDGIFELNLPDPNLKSYQRKERYTQYFGRRMYSLYHIEYPRRWMNFSSVHQSMLYLKLIVNNKADLF
jgi:hypothetical protein